jgi:catalase
MASSVTGGLHKVEQAVKSVASADKKAADLSRDTVDVHTKTKFTTDYGVPVSDTDHWLKVVNEKTSGPSLLEDQVAREKVSTGPTRWKQRA